MEVSTWFPGPPSPESIVHWYLRPLSHSDLGGLTDLVLVQVLVATSSPRQCSRQHAAISAPFTSKQPASGPRSSKRTPSAPLVVLSFRFASEPELTERGYGCVATFKFYLSCCVFWGYRAGHLGDKEHCFLTGAEGQCGKQGTKADKWKTEPFSGGGETSLRGRVSAWGSSRYTVWCPLEPTEAVEGRLCHCFALLRAVLHGEENLRCPSSGSERRLDV